LVFILTFRDYQKPDVAMGSNLMGAIAGGACESFSFVIGINALGFIAGIFYIGSLILVFKKR
jgi:hypothetical protein